MSIPSTYNNCIITCSGDINYSPLLLLRRTRLSLPMIPKLKLLFSCPLWLAKYNNSLFTEMSYIHLLVPSFLLSLGKVFVNLIRSPSQSATYQLGWWLPSNFVVLLIAGSEKNPRVFPLSFSLVLLGKQKRVCGLLIILINTIRIHCLFSSFVAAVACQLKKEKSTTK